MNKFVRSLLAELIPVWMTPQEPRRDEPPAPGREPNPGSRPGRNKLWSPKSFHPLILTSRNGRSCHASASDSMRHFRCVPLG